MANGTCIAVNVDSNESYELVSRACILSTNDYSSNQPVEKY